MKTQFLSFLTALTFFRMSADKPQISECVSEHSSLLTTPMEILWANPSINAERFSVSLSNISAGGVFSKDNRFGFFKAETYLTSDKYCITGFARYINGKQFHGVWTETAEPDRVTPYLTFANGNGSMRHEEYSFGGSYTARLGRWNVSLEGRYIAGLYFRTVDPRPRNITGLLHLNPSFSFYLNRNYLISAGILFEKYKQSSSISFVGELGHNLIYHLTGLGTVYARFNGKGESSYYDGNTCGGQIGLFPIEKGFFVGGLFNNIVIKTVLSDLNKLPLARTASIKTDGTVGWRNRQITACITGSWKRLRGIENIFGDAVSGQYPEIASLTLYSCTDKVTGLSAAYGNDRITQDVHNVHQRDLNKSVFSCLAEVRWQSHKAIHLSDNRHLSWQRILASVSARGSLLLKKGGFLSIYLNGCLSSPLSHDISGINIPEGDLIPVYEHILHEFNLHTTSRLFGEAKVEALFPIKKIFLVGFSTGILRSLNALNQFNATIDFIF